MDKTFNDLVDIVHRTKKINGKNEKATTSTGLRRRVSNSEVVEHDIEEQVGARAKAGLKGASAISSFLEKSPTKKKAVASKSEPVTKKTTKKAPATKKSTKTTPKTTAKATAKPAKKTPTKKPTTIKSLLEKENKKKAQTKQSKVEKENKIKDLVGSLKNKTKKIAPTKPSFDLNDLKNAQMYETLKSTLFSEGTDISAFMEPSENAKTIANANASLKELKAKREASNLNREISREQQEYEQLFTGSLTDWQVDDETPEEKQAEVEDTLNDDYENYWKNLEKKQQEEKSVVEEKEEQEEVEERQETKEEYYERNEPLYERDEEKIKAWNTHNEEIDRKIAEYYRRKQEKIAEEERRAQEEAMNLVADKDEYEDRKSAYQDVFGGEMTTRASLMGYEEPKVEEQEETIASEEQEVEKEDAPEEINFIDIDDKEDDEIIEELAEEIEDERQEYDEYNKVEHDEPEDYVVTPTMYEDREQDREAEDFVDRTVEYLETTDFSEDDEYFGDLAEDDEETVVVEETPEEVEEIAEDIIEQEETADYRDYIVEEDDKEDYLDNYIIEEPEEYSRQDAQEENIEPEIVEENDTISREEFYAGMKTLQENIINEIKNATQDEESEDEVVSNLFGTTKETEVVAEEETPEVVEEIAEEQVEEPAPAPIAEEVATPVVQEVQAETELSHAEELKAKVVTNADVEITGSLLNAEEHLSEKDLEYLAESEKEKEHKVDDYFYLSPEDNENKIKDEYLDIYNDKKVSNTKEVGDININKDIQNAIPSSKVFAEIVAQEKHEVTEEEMQAIYTIFGVETKKKEKEDRAVRVLYVTSECQPFVASGGLADVAGSLPKFVAANSDMDIRVIMPLYGNIKQDYREKFEYLGNFTVHLSWRQEYCGLFRYYSDGVTYYFIDNERYFKRDKLYGYYDDGERFAYFSKAIVEALPHLNFFPDIIHCNDWQSALVSTYIKTGNWSDFRYYKIKHIYTIHNIEYQGVYGMENLKDLFGINPRFTRDMEYNGDINLTKAAIQYSDLFTTVSDSYCDNLKQPYCSRGLHHTIIRHEYKLRGIVNGIDLDFYNPATDKCLYKTYSVETLEDKVMNKKLWQDELGLPVDSRTPMIAVVSRLVSHKGVDLLNKIIEQVLQQDVQFIIVGTGDDKYVNYYKYLEGKYPTKVRALVDKYSNENARKAYGASDIFVMPSKVEPCGLSQMIASRYGAVPIIREVGGLRDTIKDFGCIDGGNGYTFTNYNANDLMYQINRAINDYKDIDGWKKKMQICMTQDFSWNKSAKKYIDLYKSIL